MDKSHQRLIAGDSGGKLKILDAIAGTCLQEMISHSKEITFLNYSYVDKTIMSVSSDTDVRVSKDYKKVDESEKKLISRLTQENSFSNDNQTGCLTNLVNNL